MDLRAFFVIFLIFSTAFFALGAGCFSWVCGLLSDLDAPSPTFGCGWTAPIKSPAVSRILIPQDHIQQSYGPIRYIVFGKKVSGDKEIKLSITVKVEPISVPNQESAL